MRDIVARLGHPKDATREAICINIAAVEKCLDPFHDYYMEAEAGTDHEAYLLSRVKGMGDYLIACYQELEQRRVEGYDVADLTTKLREKIDAKDHPRQPAQD